MSTYKPSSDDWRRQGQEAYLRGRHLSLALYTPYRVGWDHDHCEFCGSKFSELATDLREGYTTDDRYYWICPKCFSDFLEEFGWTTE
jgi:hypothetical protein